MRRALGPLAAIAALCAHHASAQPAADPAQMLGFYEGCWRGVFVGAPQMSDERCFTAVLGGKHVRDAHVVRGGPQPYAGETMYSFDAEKGVVTYAYVASDGGLSRGVVRAEGETLVFPEDRYVDGDGAVSLFRATWRPDGPDRFVAVTEAEGAGGWREVMRIEFTRAPELSASQ